MSQKDWRTSSIGTGIGGNGAGTPNVFPDMPFPVRVKLSSVTITATDTAILLDIPAGVSVEGIAVNRITAEGATGTVSIGDSSSATLYLSSGSINGTGYLIGDGSTGGGTTFVKKFYAAQSQLIITFNNTNTVAEFDVVVNLESFYNPIGNTFDHVTSNY